MYTLFAIDTVLRISAALVLLFIVVPALAWPRPASFSRTEWFWWNLGAGITILTLAGQLFTLLNIAGPLSYLALFLTIIVLGRARAAGVRPLHWIAESYRATVLFALHVLDGRGGLRERFSNFRRDLTRRISATLSRHRGAFAALAITGVAAAIVRFYRPFATANLGFSDTYAHLYLMRLLDEGRQLDPQWGPYPHGMHFLLLAIQRLTNVDPILLMNFFGAFVGVLIALAVADTARRVTRSNTAALAAGVLFATMIGGASQYFTLGGSVAVRTPEEARFLLGQSYAELSNAGEFDVLFTAFQRQTTTLPQELAIVLLFPAVLFFIDWLRVRHPERSEGPGRAGRDAHASSPTHPGPSLTLGMTARWRLAGFALCTAAIASVHSGVLMPLIALCAAATIATLVTRDAKPRDIARGAIAGAVGIAIGSTWMLGFLHQGSSAQPNSNAANTALYYFPFLRGESDARTFMMLTPFLIVVVLAAITLAVIAYRAREPHTLTIALGTIFFVITHSAPVLGIPELIEVRRNTTWLAMAAATLLGIAIAALAARLPRRLPVILPIVAIALWCATIPNIAASTMRVRLLDYSGYGTTTYAVLRISQQLEPYTWTLVSYGQEYPMVLGRGFHLNGSDFVEQFDPTDSPLRIPTPHVFIVVEKKPHRFQIDNWSKRFDRTAVEERLQTWCTVYALTHKNIRVWLDDENVRIYEITATGDRS
ncbi:MAG TPA: hypothetical protein VGQ76_21540 [Thermoanaerobaculia bacterium]|jgi:hypothetical protein|nr:hypothetical protein [Thermoanaerobaculia bacterium]